MTRSFRDQLEAVARWLLGPLWALEVVRVAGLPGALEAAALILLALYLVVAAALARPATRLLCGGLGAAALAAAAFGGHPGDLVRGLGDGLIFAAFIPTLAWLRAAAERAPAVARSRDTFAAMTGRARTAGLQIGAHLFGAVITAGVFGLFGPLRDRSNPVAERAAAAQATVRGMCLAVLWSPCFVGMALASRFLPEVALWQIIPAGMAMALAGLLLADFLFGLRSPQAMAHAVTSGFRPILVPLGVGAGTVLVVTGATPLSSLEAVLVTLPPLGLLWLRHSGASRVLPAARDTWQRLGRMADDLLIVVLAMVLAAALAGNGAVVAALQEIAALDPPASLIIAGVLWTILLLSFAGLHPMVAVSVLVPLVRDLPGSGVAPEILMLIALHGWSLGTMNSPSSLSIVLAAASFQVPYRQLLLGSNLVFVLIYASLAALLLALVNPLLAAAA